MRFSSHVPFSHWHSQKKEQPSWRQLALLQVSQQCTGAEPHGVEVATEEEAANLLALCTAQRSLISCWSVLSLPQFILLLLGPLRDFK